MALPKIVQDIEARVRDVGDALTGTLTWPGNVVALNFRTGHASYDGTITYQTSGNEALVFGTKQGVTSFIFVNGEDTITNNSATRWTSLTSPGLQIKNNCVSIGQLWGDTVTPDYKLKVVGNTYLNGSVTVGGALTLAGNITAPTFIGALQGNADTATTIAYPAQLTSDSAIDNFNVANRFQVGTWGSTSSPGVSNGIIVNFGWTNATYGAQMAIDDDPTYYLSLRQRNGNGWSAWKRIPMGDGTGASGTWGISISGNAGSATKVNSLRTINGTSHAVALQNEFNSYKASIPRNCLINYYSSAYGNGSQYMGYFLSGYDSSPYGGFFVAHYTTPYYVGIAGGGFYQYQIWKSGDSVTGAVWNDYAEYRQGDTVDPGYCLIEVGDDTLIKSTERMQSWAGISSDTWGFAQGETEKAKTPIAVAGRVLAYPYQDRTNYKPGDCVCTAPGGKVDIMTDEEIYKHPDKIIGVVSCVPDYEEWGGGELADRPPVKVNGRIWIRVK